MELTLVRADDPILRAVVPTFDGDHATLGPLARSMLELVKRRAARGKHQIGIGLAAPQIGHALRLFVMSLKGGRDYVCINPRIHDSAKRMVPMYEDCLTLPGNHFRVDRSEHILAEWWDQRGQQCRSEFRGILARVFQHERDHLEGRVIWPRHAETPVASSAAGEAAGAAT